jgi:hypothetical protein
MVSSVRMNRPRLVLSLYFECGILLLGRFLDCPLYKLCFRMRPNHLVVTDPNSSLSEAIELMLLLWVNTLRVVAQVVFSSF